MVADALNMGVTLPPGAGCATGGPGDLLDLWRELPPPKLSSLPPALDRAGGVAGMTATARIVGDDTFRSVDLSSCTECWGWLFG